MKNLLAVAVVAVSGTVFADAAAVQKPGGDLSADETWTDKDGNVVPHGADTDWEFKQSNSTGYTASDNITAVSLSWTKPTTIDLTGEPLRKVQLGSATAEGNKYAIYPCCSRTVDVYPANSGELHIKGGHWDLGNWNLLAVKGWNRGANAQLWISDGAVMTNINQIQYANRAAQNALRITGGSAVYVRRGNLKFNDAAATQTYFELSGGSVLSIGNEGGNANFGIFNETSWSTNLIAGAGTVFTNANNLAETVTAYNTLFHVDDGAKAYFNGPYCYYDPSSNNEIRVTRGAELHTRGTFYFSYGVNAQNNRLFIGDGGVFRAGGTPFNGVGNEICVSNGVWSGNAAIFQGKAKDCTFRVKGDRNTVNLIHYLDGTGSRIVMDGAKFDMASGLYMSTSDACSNALEIVNGSVVTAPHVRFEVYSAASKGFRGARLLVAGRSEFRPGMINVSYADNSIIIDDATIRTMTDNNIALMLAAAAPKGPTEGNRLVLKGRAPLFDATNGGTVYFRSNAVIRIEMPVGGFATDSALVRAKAWSSDGTTRFEFPGLGAVSAATDRPVTNVLFETVGSVSATPFSAAEFARAEAAVRAEGPNCRLLRDGNRILLAIVPDYDLHTRALVPVVESPVPADGEPIDLVKDGEYRFAIAWDVGCEKQCGSYKPTTASIGPAVDILTEAFEHTFGRKPDVIDAKDEAALARYDHILAVGASPVTRALGYDPAAEPDQGFTVATRGKVLVIHGSDASQIPGYNVKQWERRPSSWGSYYGALDFAERFLGVRYFYPGEWGTLWRPRRNLRIRPVGYTDAPWFNARGSLSHFNRTFMEDDLTNKWTALLGPGSFKYGDGSFVRRWRQGSSKAMAGSHAPDPQKFGARHPEAIGDVFYLNPYGCRAWYPDQHYPNLFDVTNLKAIDWFIDDIKAQFAMEQPPWDTWGWPSLSTTYVPWGQCDTYLSLIDIAFDREVRALGLIDPRDIERARQPDGNMRKDAGCFANVWGRFVKTYAERVRKEFPGEKLYCLVYYNAKFPPNDPRWKLPDNVEVAFCDHRMPRRMFNASDRADILRIAKEWYEALGHPVARSWLYTSNADTFARAVTPEFAPEVPKALGQYLGRDCNFFDCNGYDDLWHCYYAHYACFHAEWNPDLDVDAAIDEHWGPFYGEETGACLREFHRILKANVMTNVCMKAGLTENEKYDAKLSAPVLDELERLLAAAEASVEKGTDFERRLGVFAYPWPEAIRKRREEIASEYVFTPEERAVWKRSEHRIDSWDGVYAAFRQDPDPYVGNRATLAMDLANRHVRYTFNLTSTMPTFTTPARQASSIVQGRRNVGFSYGDTIIVTVNGTSFKDIEILPTDIVPWSEGRARGYEVRMAFPNAPVRLRISLKPYSKLLDFALIPEPGAAVSSARVEIVATPSYFRSDVSDNSRFYDYRREIVTATRTVTGVRGQPQPELFASDRYFVMQDAEYDGSDETKGVGPCFATADFAAVASAKAFVNDYWKVTLTFDLRPAFDRFDFSVYEDKDRRVSNAAFAVPSGDPPGCLLQLR